jgi:hypothetical protein
MFKASIQPLKFQQHILNALTLGLEDCDRTELSSGNWLQADCSKFTDISQENTASVFRVEELTM